MASRKLILDSAPLPVQKSQTLLPPPQQTKPDQRPPKNRLVSPKTLNVQPSSTSSLTGARMLLHGQRSKLGSQPAQAVGWAPGAPFALGSGGLLGAFGGFRLNTSLQGIPKVAGAGVTRAYESRADAREEVA